MVLETMLSVQVSVLAGTLRKDPAQYTTPPGALRNVAPQCNVVQCSGNIVVLSFIFCLSQGNVGRPVGSCLFILYCCLGYNMMTLYSSRSAILREVWERMARVGSPYGCLAQIALHVQNGAVFYVNPSHGCVRDDGSGTVGTCTLAQLTVASTAWTANVNLHGRTSNAGDAQRWEQTAITFSDESPAPTVRQSTPSEPERTLHATHNGTHDVFTMVLSYPKGYYNTNNTWHAVTAEMTLLCFL